MDDNTFVIYTEDVEKLKAFLAAFGLTFTHEKHGTGPEHYSATSGNGQVLEVYPKRRKD